MTWQALIDWQITSFGGNPAVMVEVTSGNLASVQYTAEQVAARGLRDSIKTFYCLEPDSFECSKGFKDGAVSFAFLNGNHDYATTLKHLREFYDLVHYNSLMAGSGADEPEVRRALTDFCKEKGVPWKIFSPGVWSINHCHRAGQ